MTGRYIEEEMNRFEAEIHRQPMNSFGPPRMFLPPQMRSVSSYYFNFLTLDLKI